LSILKHTISLNLLLDFKAGLSLLIGMATTSGKQAAPALFDFNKRMFVIKDWTGLESTVTID